MGPPFLLLIFSTVAFVFDIKTMKIPNAVILCGYVSGLMSEIYLSRPSGLILFAAGSAIPVILLWITFRFRMIGAGDIKLLSAIGGIILYPSIIRFLVATLVFSSVLSLIQMLRCGIFKQRFLFFFRYISDLIHGKYYPYRKNGSAPENIHLTVPVLMSTVLYAGGML